MHSKARNYLIILSGIALIGASSLSAQDYVRNSGPDLFSYDELVQLSLDKPLTPALAEKLHHDHHSLHQQ